MNYVTITFLAFSLIWAKIRDKCLVNPIIVTSFIWLCILVGYDSIDHGLYPLSDRFYLAFLAWMLPFYFSCETMIRVGSAANIRHLAHPATPFITNKYLILIVSLSVVGAFCLNYQQAMQFDPTNYIAGVKEAHTATKQQGVGSASPLYLNLYRVGQISYVLCLIYSLKKIQFKFKNLFFALAIFFCIMGGDKGGILTFFLGYFGVLCFTNRLNIRILIGSMLLLFIAVYTIQFFRGVGGEMNLIDLLYIYLFSPLPAFDTYILHSTSDFTTYFTGDLVFKNVPLLGRLMVDNYNPMNVNYFDYQMVRVPLPTNVYTMMAGYWAAWKWPGLLVGGGLHGLFWGYLYGRSRRAEVYKVLYVTNLYMLVFYFFHDFLMEHFGSLLRMSILLFLLLYNPMFKHKHV